MDALANARTQMIATLDSFRDTLEDLGGGLGVTDPVSGSGGAGAQIVRVLGRAFAAMEKGSGH